MSFYRLLNGLCLKNSNVTCTYVGTGFPEKRSTFFKAIPNEKASEAEPEQDDEEGDTIDNNNESVKISGRKGKEVPRLEPVK